ncbi:MaoC family dehydratase [Comamonas sp. SCN 65-56]|uniref:MaoC family dehydratase n=1 Tax=Comamonas sp. SCN 65-56 TaxID=1660095 RepID=UPI000A40E14E|nr:MaoC family dehydratase [Comamonas sp. SCN 65-56]
MQDTQTNAPRHLEDFRIGDVIETASVTVTREMIVAFAREYDPQPMHLDESAARQTVFGELVGSGWQTLALTMRLLVDARLLGSTPIVGAEFKEMRFHAPVRPGDSLHARVEVTGLRASRSRPERGFLDMTVTTLNADGAPLITQHWSLVLPTRTAPV